MVRGGDQVFLGPIIETVEGELSSGRQTSGSVMSQKKHSEEPKRQSEHPYWTKCFDDKEISMRSSSVFALPGTMVVVSLMVAGVATVSFAVQRSERNVQMAPGQCRESINEKLVEQAHSIVFKMNPKGEITFFNKFAQKFFGFPEKEIVGKNLIGTIVPKTDSSGRDLRPILEDVFRHPEQHVTNTNENISRSGERVWVSWVNLPVIDNNGNLTEILCIGNPISKGKQKGLAALLPKKS